MNDIAQHIQLLPHEVFEKCQELKTREERIALCNANNSFALRTILQLAYNDHIELDLPEGTPPFEKNQSPSVSIDKAIKTIGQFSTFRKDIGRIKKETSFINLLESLHPKDAECICLAKDKKFQKTYTKVTEAFVQKAFPELLKK